MQLIKIVFVVSNLTSGGAELMLLRLLENIDKKRFQISVISLRKSADIGPKITSLGLPLYSLNLSYGLTSIFSLIYLILILIKIRPHIIQTWMYHADLIGGLAGCLIRCKNIIWGIRNGNLDPNYSKKSTFLIVKICSYLSRFIPKYIISCSDRATFIHINKGYCSSKFITIPNGFDLNKFKPNELFFNKLRTELKIASNSLIVGLIARYDPQKNHPGFIDAAQIIKSKNPKVHFVMAGAGVSEKNEDLMRLINKYHLSECVHLLGKREDIEYIMAGLNILVSTSTYGEAFPNVLAEAMSCGVPCVSTDVGDSSKIIGKYGKVVKINSMNELAENVIELLEVPDDLRQQNGILARNWINDNFSLVRITKSYENFYDSLSMQRDC